MNCAGSWGQPIVCRDGFWSEFPDNSWAHNGKSAIEQENAASLSSSLTEVLNTGTRSS
jgi:type IV secretory pathway VirB4 component